MLKPLSVQDIIENQIIAQYGSSGTTIAFWVGGYKSNGVWLWMDGTDISAVGSKWRAWDKNYMILSSWHTTRNDMHWYSGFQSESVEKGYVCEVAVIDPCIQMQCQNEGTCIATGCQGNCRCAAGFKGDLCDTDRITIIPSQDEYQVTVGQSVEVEFTLTSDDGSVRIDIYNGTEHLKYVTEDQKKIAIEIGPFQTQTEGDRYQFRAAPESAPTSYSRYAYVTIRVEGPSSLKISLTVLAIPTGTIQKSVKCEATGVPKPTLTWKYEGVEITRSSSAAVYQFTYGDYRYIRFTTNARTEVGNYTCFAEKTVGGEKKVSSVTLFVRGQLQLINNTERKSESPLGISTFSCTYEGYPAGNIHWKWAEVEGSPRKINATEIGSIFEVQNTVEKKSTLFQTTSALTIKLHEYLGSSKVACYASNEYETPHGIAFRMNQNLILSGNNSYRIYDVTMKRNLTDARAFCQKYDRTLVRIADHETQELLSKKMIKRAITGNVFIGAQKHTRGSISIWKWTNGDFLYNETKGDRIKVSGGQIIDGSYVAWTEGEPNETGNECAVLDYGKQWSWSDATCTNEHGFICESTVAGISQDFVVDVEKCTSNITVKWKAGKKAIGVKHRIEVQDIASASKSLEKVPVDQNQITQHFLDLKPDTKYSVEISVCPDCARPYKLTKAVSTYAKVPADNLSVTEANVTREGDYCVLKWKLHNSTGVAGFNIIAHSVIVHTASRKYTNQHNSESSTTSREKSGHAIVPNPNREYTFSIRVETCLGHGKSTAVQGNCISNRAGPRTVPKSIVTPDPNEGGAMNIEIVLPDESNGPLSCIFVIVVYKPSASSEEEYNLQKLQKAMSKTKASSFTANDAYVALAIKRSDVGEKASIPKKLGDGTSSNCDVTTEKTRKRRKRSTSNTNIEGNNRKLEDEASYSYFTVTATPLGDGNVNYTTSETSSFEKHAANSHAGMIAGIIVALLVVIILVVGIVYMVKKRKLLGQKNTEEMGMQQLEDNEENLYANLVMDNRGPRSETDIKLENLQATYNSLTAKDNTKFQSQFLALKEKAKQLEYPTEFSSNITLKRKNRYKNILPPDRSRVVLSGEGDSSYINACYIHGYSSPKKFIATQGPLPGTVNDFWKMIVERKCTVIAMLTRVTEKSKVKCEKYWPDLDSTQLFGDIIVENANEKSFGSYKLRILVVKDEKQTITVNHFHFLYWPDHGVPVTTTNLVRYHEAVSKPRANTPIVVHCSAGAGRTGAFIAYDFLCEEAESLSSVDVYRCVMTLREQRVDMVQNCEQYILVHKLLLERYLFGKTEAAIDEITRDIPSETSLRKEFNNLSVVAPINHANYGDQQNHRTLNRNQNIIPYKRNRVTMVMRDTEAEVPYINASILETYDPSIKLISAQGPVKASIEHFWRAIFDNNVNTIVMLTKCVESKKEQSVRYWPDEKEGSIALKDMTVVFRSMDSAGHLITREFQVTREDEGKIITQYQYIGWNSDGKPENASDILELVENMHAHVHNIGGEMALVHCSDGAGRTGAFCAIVNMLQRLKCENKVDVFRTVKDLRDYRPGMVQTMEQYRFCYEAVSSYLTSFHLYSNLAAEKQENGEEESIYQNM